MCHFKSLFIVLATVALSAIGYAQESQWASEVIEVSSQLTPTQYSAKQALGVPNVLPSIGESPSAWTPYKPNNKEFIKVGFATPISIRQIIVAESYGSTAITKIFTYDEAGKEYLIKVLSPTDMEIEGRIFSVIVSKTKYKVAAIKLEFDGKRRLGYFSIDAIGVSGSARPTDVEVRIMKNLNTNLLSRKMTKKVNSPYKEYKPLLSPDGNKLFFSRSNHPGNVGGVEDKEDIWYSEKDERGNWKEAVNVGRPLNNASPNYVCSISPDGNSMVLLLGNEYSKKRGGDKMRSGVSMSTKTEDGWSEPANLSIKNGYNLNEKADYFLADNKKILLLSVERDDTEGSRDLYVSFSKKDNTWTEPLNLGNRVNTAGDESSPFLTVDNKTLYYSTNGLGGFGGHDVYVTKRLDDTWENWSKPENLGPSINSEKSDLFFTIPSNGQYAYYSQEVEEGGDSDIFRIKLPLEAAPKEVIVTGILLDRETGKPVEGKTIYKKMPKETVINTVNVGKDGRYKVSLPNKHKYIMVAEAKEYVTASININLMNRKYDKVALKNLYLVPKNKPSSLVSGTLLDKKTGKPVEAKIIYEKLPEGKIIGTTKTGKDGKYKMNLPKGHRYGLRVESKKYLPQNVVVDLTDKNKKDILKNLYLIPAVESSMVKISGVLSDKITGKPIEAHLIFEKLPEGVTAGIAQSDEKGKYEIPLTKGYKYGVRADPKGYLPTNTNIDLTNVKKGQHPQINLSLTPEKTGATISLNNLFFNSGKAIILEESFPELDRLAIYLMKNKNVKISVRGHTDSVGKDSYNMALSKRRSEAVFKYLVSQRVNPKRLAVEWFGETQPIETNDTEKGRKANRRVEFKITKI